MCAIHRAGLPRLPHHAGARLDGAGHTRAMGTTQRFTDAAVKAAGCRRAALHAALVVAALWAAQVMALETQISRQGRTLELHISDEFDPAARRELRTWVEFSAGALEQVFGHWPRQRWRVRVQPLSAAGDDPIPWATVRRERIDVIEYFVTPRADARQLMDEWTGYHEMAHLLIPYRGWGDTWFSEGLATYYQNLLRARAGVFDERAMWQAFHDGFQRGAADSAFDGQALAAVSDAMRRNGGYMRVYWSGAWYFLKADTRLRRQSQGRLTLDIALARLNACCATAHLPVPQIVARLDELNRVYVFEPLYDTLRASTALPAYTDLFKSLGIDIVAGEVRLQDTGPGAELRRQIANPGAL